MPKRKREEDSYDSYPSKRAIEPAPMEIIPLIGRSSRRYTSRSTSSRSSYRRGRKTSYKRFPYGYPKNRGTYARINRMTPELKSLETINPYTPVRMGDVTNFDFNYTPGTGAGYNGAAADIFSTYIGTNIGGLIFCVNAVTSGTAINGRVGRTITNKSLLLNVIWRLGPGIAENTIPVSVRTMVVWDRQTNALQPNISSVLQPVIHVGNPYAQPHSPNLLENRDRYRVLYDFRSTLTPGGDSVKVIDKYIKLGNGETVFNTTSSSDASSISSGALYVIHVSDCPRTTAQADSQTPFVTQDLRFRFTDL